MAYQVKADVHVGAISRVDLPQKHKELPLLFMEDGAVLKLRTKRKAELLPFLEAEKNNLVLKISINKKRQILGVETLGVKSEPAPEKMPFEEYIPTVLNSEEEAKSLFSSLRRGARSESQCYNRAHIWSYESKKKHDVNSMKVFMFYTRKYIREYNFHWWFHVSPFTYIYLGEEKQERVLDFKFTRMPLPMKNWTDIFMDNNAVCPSIEKYSQYENNQQKEYCYLFKTSMFDYQPIDLKRRESTGALKTNWVNWEIKNAYRNGFGIW
jgi:hypothetical protein